MKKYVVCGLFVFSMGLMAQDGTRYLTDPLPLQWADDSSFQQTMPVDEEWWTGFQDTTLDSLIEWAILRNRSVLTAIHSMEQARLNWRIEQSDFFPSVGMNLGWQRNKTSGHTTGVAESWYGYYNTTATFAWEVDIFGGIRKRVKEQKQLFRASEEEYRFTLVSLCAEVAVAYFNLREAQQELVVVEHNCASQKAVVEITEVRYKTGLASQLDVVQAQSVYYSTLASIPGIEADVIQYKNQLAILLGTYPAEVGEWLDGYKPLPDYMEVVGVGLPAELLLRRPDVRAAERQVEAQAAALGAARSDWFPNFYLNGNLGFASKDLSKLYDSKSFLWEIAPSITWTIFNGGERLNTERLARIQLDEAINQFNSTVLTAVQEVDNAMATYRNAIKQIVYLRQAVFRGQQALKLSLDLYKQGLSPFQNVLDAQRTVLSYEDSLVQAKGYSLVCLVQMYKALGGGF